MGEGARRVIGVGVGTGRYRTRLMSPNAIPTAPLDHPVRLACLLSGGGTTLQNIAEHIAGSGLHAQVVLAVASNDQAYGITRAGKLGVPCPVIRRKDFDSTAAFSAAIFKRIEASGAELVCMCGFLSLLHIPEHWLGRVMNIHPGLLPAFGGRGMHGHHVHEAVIAHGAKLSGCTVHFADNTYDTGPILVQRSCAVLPDDTGDTLAARVFEQECAAYPEAIAAWAAGRVRLAGHVARIV